MAFRRHNKDMSSSSSQSSSGTAGRTAGNPHFIVHPTGSDLDATTRQAVGAIEKANAAVDAGREKLRSDPDTLSDKALRSAIPALATLVGSRGIAAAWKKMTGSDHTPGAGTHDGLVQSMLFAAVSAALGALISQTAVSAVSAFIRRRQRRR